MDVQRGNNQDIDRIIRQKMNHIRPEFRPGSWDRLAERLDEAEATDAFDSDISSRLQRMSVPYQESSWAKLAARLELERRRIQAIFHYKAMEVSLLLLLFMTAWHHLPLQQQEEEFVLPPEIPVAALENDEEINSAQATIVLQPFASEQVSLTTPTEAQSENNALPTEAFVADASTGTKSSASHSAVSNWSNRSFAINQEPVSPLITDEVDGIVYENPDAQTQLKTFFAQKADRLSSPSDNFAATGPLAALDGGETPLLDYGDPAELLNFIRPVERKTFLRIGFIGSPDYNRIVTPSQEVVDGTVVSYDRYSLGYGGGITLGVEHGRWEIETGAIYAARSYQAIPTVYISGNLREGYNGIGLSNIELNTVQAPLNFRYNFILHDKWRFYAQGGASLNVVLGANYYVADQAEFAGIQRDPGGNNNTSAVVKPAPLRDKSLTAGWLEGGSFWDNTTLYGDFGMGIERYMSPSWSMFVQPTYRHALPLFNTGLGPYRDRIHNFGIGMGVKVRL
ncbi:MAG: hypothetical protein AAFY48_13440 [Bacteroidota bacterium]